MASQLLKNYRDSYGDNLNVDHIISFIEILKVWKIKTLEDALNCPDLWDINNGRTLCLDCHRKTDTYGRKSILNI